jgi:prepilin-type N-terminal cleavage/methylation domain-containing protein/prepilin-type processing-associated H-X9-DG protein
MSITPRSPSPRAFSLIELLCAIAIIVLLGALLAPSLDAIRTRAESASCASHLQQIGLAMVQKVQDNNNTYPKVESDPTNPVYPPEAGAESLAIILKPYGITERTLRCATDARTTHYFSRIGTSYEWFPLVDGELSAAPNLYLPSGTLSLPISRIPMASDFSSVHLGRQNVLFADGHVKSL